MLNVLD